MAVFGYARVSTDVACCLIIRAAPITITNTT
jgi:hypothetical protein